MSDSTIEIVYDVTERAKEILRRESKGKERHVLIEIDTNGTNEPVSSYFQRGATTIVGKEVFDRAMYAEATDANATSAIDARYNEKFIEMNPVFANIAKYKMQNFIYNVAGIFTIALGQDSYSYKPRFSNGKICHIWKERIKGEDCLCMLSVEDGFSIEAHTEAGDRESYYIPGAVMLEIKVPVSVLQNMEPITDEHIFRVLVTSKKLFDLLYANPNLISLLDNDSPGRVAKLKEALNRLLDASGSKAPLQNLGSRIKEPNFKDMLPDAINKKRVKLSPQPEAKPMIDAGLDYIFMLNKKNVEDLAPVKGESVGNSPDSYYSDAFFALTSETTEQAQRQEDTVSVVDIFLNSFR